MKLIYGPQDNIPYGAIGDESQAVNVALQALVQSHVDTVEMEWCDRSDLRTVTFRLRVTKAREVSAF